VPKELGDWMKVNPRIPLKDKHDHLKGPVAQAIMNTLREEPETFALKNQGIYLLAKTVAFEKAEGGGGVVTVIFEDEDKHGLMNGGHTFLSIDTVDDERDQNEPWDAYVRVHVFEGIDEALITDLAEGLNRSMQVDNPSLENLRGSFDEIKTQMEKKQGHEQIAYRQGELGEIDVQQVLTYMGVLDLKEFSDDNKPLKHPHTLFGQPKAVLQKFTVDTKGTDSSFDRIVTHVHEILVLADEIQKQGAEQTVLAKLKITNAKKGNRTRSPKNKKRPAHFAGGTIDGAFPLGWVLPMLAAFRANVSKSAWNKGKFQWTTDPFDLLEATIEEMAEIIRDEHVDNKKKPAEVGRKVAAYRACYGVVTTELARRGLLES
jgi:hypothetical protein